jgi:sugar-phosphatase
VNWPISAAALLIDLDGTLVDSHASIMRAWSRWATDNGVDPAHVQAIMPGRTATAVMREVRPDLAASELARQERLVLDWQVADNGDVTALAGAYDLLAALPIDRWAVVTACDRRLARARLHAAGLPIPQVLVGCDTVATSKPDPAGYLTAARALNTAPGQCLVIEDAAAGVAAGLAAGMRVLAVADVDGADLVVSGLAEVRLEAGHAGAPLRLHRRD